MDIFHISPHSLHVEFFFFLADGLNMGQACGLGFVGSEQPRPLWIRCTPSCLIAFADIELQVIDAAASGQALRQSLHTLYESRQNMDRNCSLTGAQKPRKSL